jgi:photosystem II stability/assembly factor-like uncharacterized protein
VFETILDTQEKAGGGLEPDNPLIFRFVSCGKNFYRSRWKMQSALIRLCISAAILCAVSEVAFATSEAKNAFRDPLLTPAATLSGALSGSRQPILALAKLGDGARFRLVAAGLRGVILLSDDGGSVWRQVRVPVQSDLVSLCFVSAQKGWAVGHDGVILHSDDGGQTWIKQFDGVRAQEVLTSYYKARIAEGEKNLQPFLDEVELNTRDGPILPFLSVYFENERTGYAVGSFGMLVKTEDGGNSWQPWLDHIDNDKFLNLNDIREIAGNVYIAGEQGTVYRLDRKRQRFVAISPMYKGSFFHIVGDDTYLLVMGLGGTAFRSADGGHSWEPVTTGMRTSLTSAALSADGKEVVLAAEGGQLVCSTDEARTFRPLHVDKPMSFADVVAGNDDWFVFAGYQGVERQMVCPATKLAPVQK